jgi:CheY-like chemotaxis protein
MRVLYVEDNPANVFLVKRVAKMGNHEIINYVDGNDVLNNFANVKPDLILMDIQISGTLTGLDVVRKLREWGIQTPIIAVTAYAMVGDRERCIAAGCNDYMAKPLPIPQLVKLFEHYSQLRFATNELERLGTNKQEVASAEVTKKVTAETAVVVISNPEPEVAVVETTPKPETITPAVMTDTPVKADEKISIEETKPSNPEAEAIVATLKKDSKIATDKVESSPSDETKQK